MGFGWRAWKWLGFRFVENLGARRYSGERVTWNPGTGNNCLQIRRVDVEKD
jgi:hypothetical protein